MVVPGGVDRSGERRVIPVLLALIERLAARHEVEVFALAQYEEPCRYPLLGANVTNLGRPRTLAGLPGRTRLWHLSKLSQAIRAGHFDVVHAFWATEPGWLATAAAARTALPSVLSLAGGELTALPDIGYGAQSPWRSRLLVAQALRRASVVTCASGPMAHAARSRGLDPLLVPLGVPPAAAGSGSEPSSPSAPSGGERLLFVGSLNRVKNPFTLLAALRRVVEVRPGVSLDVVGEDTLDGAVQRRAAELGLAGKVLSLIHI